jgi:hypothetical protein
MNGCHFEEAQKHSTQTLKQAFKWRFFHIQVPRR